MLFIRRHNAGHSLKYALRQPGLSVPTMLPTLFAESHLPTPLVEACLNAINFGVLLLDAGGNVLFSNTHAVSTIDRYGGIGAQLRENGVNAIHSAQLRRHFSELITQASLNVVSRKYTHENLELDIVACSAQDSGSVFFLRDSRFELPEPFFRRMQKRYDLTPQETRIAYELAMGHAVDAIADGLRVQANTVRMHLKRIYDKTDTHCQSQLVSRLVRNVFSTDLL